jgi:lipoprotein-anchoring transpeptidase ErfK/SrfK
MNTIRIIKAAAAIATVVAATTFATTVSASPFFFLDPIFQPQQSPYDQQMQAPVDRAVPGMEESTEAPARFRRTVVEYRTSEGPGTIIIDTPNTYLYLVLGNGRAIRYGIGVGREGFTWQGLVNITQKKEWPDWTPPPEMIQRQPYLPRFMAGGPGNPLGARAMYLGTTVYRIHGTNRPDTIGTAVSSGCFRLVNRDVADLYDRVPVGTKVVIRQKPEL